MRSPWPFERLRVSWGAPRRDDSTPDLYRILGLHRRASDRKVKATYRKLAKRLHPDVNASETATERLIEINQAYQILGDPDAREAYDAELAFERSEARGRFWRGVAAGVGTFILTVSSVFLAALLILHSPSPRTGGEGAPAVNQSVASKFPERDGARSGGWAKPDLSNSDVPDKPPPTPSPAPEATSQQPLRGVASAGEVGHVGSPDKKARTSNEPAEQPGPLLVPTPREVVASAPSVVPPAAETRPVPPEDKLARTGAVENSGTPRIVDNQQPAPTVSTAQTVRRAKPSLWRLYLNAGSGFALKYPADVFPLIRTNENKDRLLTTKDRRAVLHIFSMTNEATTLSAYRQSLMAKRYAGASFDYTPQRGNWFALSGAVGEENFYERVSLSCDRRSIHGWVLAYPRGERAFYDTILAEIRSSYRHANAQCGDLKS